MPVRFGVWYDGPRPRNKADAFKKIKQLMDWGFTDVILQLNDFKNITENWNDDILFWTIEAINTLGGEAYVMDWSWSKVDRLEAQVRTLKKIERRGEIEAYQMDCEGSWADRDADGDGDYDAAEAFIEAHKSEGIKSQVGVTSLVVLDAPKQRDVEGLCLQLHEAGLLHHICPQAYSSRLASVPWTMKTDLVLPGRTQRFAVTHWKDLAEATGAPVYLGMSGYGQSYFGNDPAASFDIAYREALKVSKPLNVSRLWIWSRKHLLGAGKEDRAIRELVRRWSADPSINLLGHDRNLSALSIPGVSQDQILRAAALTSLAVGGAAAMAFFFNAMRRT